MAYPTHGPEYHERLLEVAAAADLAYDNGTSGLTAADVQAAIGEIAALFGGGSEVAYKVELDDVGGGVTYIGEATPGTTTSAADWRIKKVVETGLDIEIAWADGSAAFNQVWDDRASLSYS